MNTSIFKGTFHNKSTNPADRSGKNIPNALSEAIFDLENISKTNIKRFLQFSTKRKANRPVV
jgi:hypothetical protein